MPYGVDGRSGSKRRFVRFVMIGSVLVVVFGSGVFLVPGGPILDVILVMTGLCLVILFYVLMELELFEMYHRPVLLAMILTLLVLASSVGLMAGLSGDSFGFWQLSLMSAGTVFILCIGIVTVVGFVITLSQLGDIHYRIISFEKFHARYRDLLARAIEGQDTMLSVIEWLKVRGIGVQNVNGDSEAGDLQVLCTTPTIGNVSEPGLFEDMVKEKLKRAALDTDATIICLNCKNADRDKLVNWEELGNGDEGRREVAKELLEATPLGRFYSQFEAAPSVEKAYDAYRGAVEVIKDFEHHNKVRYFTPSDTSGDGSLRRLPQFNLFITTDRAIVAVPLDRPMDIEDRTHREVSLIGYETSDPVVIGRLRGVFNEWSNQLCGES